LKPKPLKPKTTTEKTEHSMKTQIHLAAFGLLSTVLMQSPAFGQGSLTPPGAPAPTMKTLQQVEPRTPISSAPFTISQPGSYYLTTNLTVSGGNAITIATNGVTLDLNGYTIRSTANPATGTAIWIGSGLRNVAILNGNIEGGVTNNAGTYNGPGFGYGILSSGSARAVRVSGVNVSGCLYNGINVGNDDSTVVESCAVRTVGGNGIAASVVKNCTALDCGYTAVYGATVSDCRGESTSSGTGVYANTAQSCYGSSISGTGVYAITAQNCYGSSSGSGDGVYASTALNCRGDSASGDGVYADTAQNCVGVSTFGNGIFAIRTAIGCYGESFSGTAGVNTVNAFLCVGRRLGGTAILTVMANGCYVASGEGSISATYKYNMP
jgi:hypothetical protein